MGKYSYWLIRYVETKEQESLWQTRAKYHARRAALVAIASNIAVAIGVSATAVTQSYTLGALALLCSAIVLYSCTILLAKRFDILFSPLPSAGEFNWEKYLNESYQKRLVDIDRLGLGKAEADSMKIDEYKSYRGQLDLIRSRVLADMIQPRLPIKVNTMIEETEVIRHQVDSLLEAIEDNKLKFNYEKLTVIERKLLHE